MMRVYANGYATLEKLSPSGMYLVQLRLGDELADKIRTDEYRIAVEYYRAFSKIAKGAKP